MNYFFPERSEGVSFLVSEHLIAFLTWLAVRDIRVTFTTSRFLKREANFLSRGDYLDQQRIFHGRIKKKKVIQKTKI